MLHEGVPGGSSRESKINWTGQWKQTRYYDSNYEGNEGVRSSSSKPKLLDFGLKYDTGEEYEVDRSDEGEGTPRSDITYVNKLKPPGADNDAESREESGEESEDVACLECGSPCAAYGIWCFSKGCRRSWPPEIMSDHTLHSIIKSRRRWSDPSAQELLKVLYEVDERIRKGENPEEKKKDNFMENEDYYEVANEAESSEGDGRDDDECEGNVAGNKSGTDNESEPETMTFPARGSVGVAGQRTTRKLKNLKCYLKKKPGAKANKKEGLTTPKPKWAPAAPRSTRSTPKEAKPTRTVVRGPVTVRGRFVPTQPIGPPPKRLVSRAALRHSAAWLGRLA